MAASARAIATPTATQLRLLPAFRLLLLIPCLLSSRARLKAWQAAETIDDVSGEYHFLRPEDTLALLDEEGKLKGYIDVYQGEEESDAILSYPITLGSRHKDQVEFKTGKIHQKYYRFQGSAQRGNGRKQSDPDYLRLVGELQIVTEKNGTPSTERRAAVFKSKGKAESEPE